MLLSYFCCPLLLYIKTRINIFSFLLMKVTDKNNLASCFIYKCYRGDCRWSFLLITSRSRVSGVRIRHKRQVLQDMARPLKHWLYKHRDNPYPTKTEKVLLALGSHMTLVQVREPCKKRQRQNEEK